MGWWCVLGVLRIIEKSCVFFAGGLVWFARMRRVGMSFFFLVYGDLQGIRQTVFLALLVLAMLVNSFAT